jgi:hypothetical protein
MKKKSEFLNKLLMVVTQLEQWAYDNKEASRSLASSVMRQALHGKGLFADVPAEEDPQNPVYLAVVMLLDTERAVPLEVLAQIEEAWEYVEAKQMEVENQTRGG